MRLSCKPVDAESFAPYGELLEAPRCITREDFVARIDNLRNDARPNLALIRSQPYSGEPVTVIERHPFSTQLFVPLDVEEYLVLVADGRGQMPDWSSLRTFSVRGNQGISYHAGVWHMKMAALRKPGVFAMLVHEDGSPTDCEFLEVQAIEILGL